MCNIVFLSVLCFQQSNTTLGINSIQAAMPVDKHEPLTYHVTAVHWDWVTSLSSQQLFSSVQCSHFIIDISPPQQNKLFVYCFLRPSLVSSVTQHFISSCFIATLSGQLSTALSSHQLFSEVTLHTILSLSVSLVIFNIVKLTRLEQG